MNRALIKILNAAATGALHFLNFFGVLRGIPGPYSKAERFLILHETIFKRRKDGFIQVPGDLDISRGHLVRLPDLARVVVAGDFRCSANRLVSLVGAPQLVGGTVYCEGNPLESLAGAPLRFKELRSDFGTFSAAGKIPGHLLRARDVKDGPAPKAAQGFSPLPK